MESNTIGFVELLRGLSFIFGLLFLFFRMVDSWQSKKGRKFNKQQYEKFWELIENTGIKSLPMTLTTKLLFNTQLFFSNVYKYSIYGRKVFSRWDFRIVSILIVALLLISRYFIPNTSGNIPIEGAISGILLFLMAFIIISKEYINKDINHSFWLLLILSLFSYTTLNYLSKVDLPKAILLFIIFTPFLGFMIAWIMQSFKVKIASKFPRASINIKEAAIVSAGMTTSISFLLTLLCLFCGTLISPHSVVPRSVQLQLSNVMFDGLTVATTIVIFSWIVKRNLTWFILPAIALDILLACVFAIISLYLGLMGSDNALSLKDCLNILFGRSIDGSTWEFSPSFWVMHTTFIPTLIYLSLIAFAIIGKYMTLPIMKFIRKMSGAEKPYYATATTFAFISGAIIGIALLIDWWD